MNIYNKEGYFIKNNCFLIFDKKTIIASGCRKTQDTILFLIILFDSINKTTN
jgi:hypothetical protein